MVKAAIYRNACRRALFRTMIETFVFQSCPNIETMFALGPRARMVRQGRMVKEDFIEVPVDSSYAYTYLETCIVGCRLEFEVLL